MPGEMQQVRHSAYLYDTVCHFVLKSVVYLHLPLNMTPQRRVP